MHPHRTGWRASPAALTGALVLLLIAAAFGTRAWAITDGQVDGKNTYSEVGALVVSPPGREPIVGSESNTATLSALRK